MKNCFLLKVLLITSLISNAATEDSVYYYSLPDSVKATAFITDIKITSVTAKKFSAGISNNAGSLQLIENKGTRRIVFFTDDAFSPIKAVGNGVNANRSLKGSYFNFNYNWQHNKTYKLLMAIAADSAANFYLGSAYIFLPDENKWKFLGTIHYRGYATFKNFLIRFHKSRKGSASYNTDNVWVQRNNGSWKNLKDENFPLPAINWFGHMDSLQQLQMDIKQIEDSITAGRTDAKQNHERVYYTILKEGTGRQVQVTDTVTVHYKGYLFSNGTVFDQTKDKPATFPLSRLIKGWQVGMPLCKVGGKIKLVIPSGLGYSIRTRAAKIPPNSILVFEIEVLDAKEGK